MEKKQKFVFNIVISFQSQMVCPGIESGLPRWEESVWPSYGKL
jgi:hypothetical protein